MSVRPPRLGITLGDPSGIGPELLARALAESAKWPVVPVLYGDDALFARSCRGAGVADALHRCGRVSEVERPALIPVTALAEKDARPGAPSPAGGRAQLAYLERACEALEAGELDGLCTAPLSKAQVTAAGHSFSGHTEYLAERFGGEPLMMLSGRTLHIAVHTTHLGLAQVPGALDGAKLVRQLVQLHEGLKRYLGCPAPRLALCALNPHAGEGGLFGREEQELLAPAIEKARALGLDASGPHPADALFARAAGRYDAVLAIYHDQGMIPAKLLDPEGAVNVTLGLPIVRTSPGHGVAYDIAGKGLARPESMARALALAARMIEVGGERKSRNE